MSFVFLINYLKIFRVSKYCIYILIEGSTNGKSFLAYNRVWFLQPKEIKDLKEFIKIMRKDGNFIPPADRITIKKNKKTNSTKFKLRTPKQLYTLKVDDKVKADKIMQSIPPSK